MTVVSVNVGVPREVQTREGTVLTSIFKSPVQRRVGVRKHNLDGDRQADLTVHGGPFKAVYCYPEEHYAFWSEQLPEMQLEEAYSERISRQPACSSKMHTSEISSVSGPLFCRRHSRGCRATS